MWIAAIITWVLISFVMWAVVYGGAMNDADRYEEGNHDGPDTKKASFPIRADKFGGVDEKGRIIYKPVLSVVHGQTFNYLGVTWGIYKNCTYATLGVNMTMF